MLTGMISSVSLGIRIDTGKDTLAIGESAGSNFAGSLDNIAIGENALNSINSADADQNIAIGNDALTALTEGAANTAIGFEAGQALTGGDFNTILGQEAGKTLTVNNGNTCLGYATLPSADNGEVYNIAVGYQSMQLVNHDDSDYNIAIGYQSMKGGTVAPIKCIAIGGSALDAPTHTSTGTIAIGHDALGALTTGAGNVAIGYNASYSLTTGEKNVAIGYTALATAITSDSNIAIGRDALRYHDVADGSGGNTAVGFNASRYISSGVENTAIGFSSMQGLNGNRITGTGNTCVGWKSGVAMTAASHYNTCVGHQSGFAIVDGGTYNTLMGYRAGLAMTTGDNNVAIGKDSAATPTTGTNNIYIGNGADSDSTGRDGQVAVGNGAEPQGDYDTRLGKQGGKQFFSANLTLDLGGTDEGDPCHGAHFCKIPAHSVLKSVSVCVLQLTDDADYTVKVIRSTDSSVTDDTVVGNQVDEILGAGEATTRSGASVSATDINLGSGATLKQTWYSTPDVTCTADNYVYVVFANATHSDDDTDPGTVGLARVCIEYVGQD
jgi:hypothetical protein